VSLFVYNETMRVLIQRVKKASVSVNKKTIGSIADGYVIFLGVGQGDEEKDADYLTEKTINLRIFSNTAGKFDHSLLDIKGEVLVISQFTLYGNTQKGRRPDFTKAAKPDIADKLYQYFNESLRKKGVQVKTGIFAAEMVVEIINDGPVTLMIDSSEQ